MMFHFYSIFLNLFNISYFSSGGAIISSRGSSLTILSSFDLITRPAILFTKSSPAFCKQFLDYLCLYQIIVFLYFPAINKDPFPWILTYFLILVSIECCRIGIPEKWKLGPVTPTVGTTRPGIWDPKITRRDQGLRTPKVRPRT